MVRRCTKKAQLNSEYWSEDYSDEYDSDDEPPSSRIYVPCKHPSLSYGYWKKHNESDEMAKRTICEEPFDDPHELIAWAEARCKALDADPECEHPGMFFINSNCGLPLTRLVCDSKKNGHTFLRYSETTTIIGYKNIWLGDGAVHALVLSGDFHRNAERFPIRVGIGHGRMSEVIAVVNEFGKMVPRCVRKLRRHHGL